MKTLIHSFAVVTVFFGFGTLSHAATLGPLTTTTPIAYTLTDWVNDLVFPQFNSSLGTLTSVELDLSASFQTVLTVQNISYSASSGNAKTEFQLNVVDGAINFDGNPPELAINSPAFNYSLPGGDLLTSPILTGFGTVTDTYTLSPILNEFTGNGTISLSASTLTQTLLTSNGGNTQASQVTSASLTGEVIYTYVDPVPEPTTLALAGLGALSLFLFRPRKL